MFEFSWCLASWCVDVCKYVAEFLRNLLFPSFGSEAPPVPSTDSEEYEDESGFEDLPSLESINTDEIVVEDTIEGSTNLEQIVNAEWEDNDSGEHYVLAEIAYSDNDRRWVLTVERRNLPFSVAVENFTDDEVPTEIVFSDDEVDIGLQQGMDDEDVLFIRKLTKQFEKFTLESLPLAEFDSEKMSHSLMCAVCREDFMEGEQLRQLSCCHCYHGDCVLPWLRQSGTCPVCRKVIDPPSVKRKGLHVDSTEEERRNMEVENFRSIL